jgi:ribonuclease R
LKIDKRRKDRGGGKKPEGSCLTLTGCITAHPDGYAFFMPDGGGEDIFVPASKLYPAIHGDRVKIKKIFLRGRPEGHVVSVLEHGLGIIVGRIEIRRGYYNVAPFNRRFPYTLFVRKKDGDNYRDGDIVVCGIKRYPDRKNGAEGEITKHLGNIENKGIENLIVINKYGLTREFSAKVSAQADEAAQSLPVKGENKGRTDLRGLFTVTIDGETARDFDDAISVKKCKDGWTLYVHIADVAHYIRPGAELDEEAYRRGTSVYFPEFAIPMLPEALSNNVCSLCPEEDRFAVSVKIKYSKTGERLGCSFYNAVIRSDRRLTYGYVNELLAGREVSDRKVTTLAQKSAELMEIISNRRRKQGAIDFDLPEAEFCFDKNGEITDIFPEERGISERIIENFMIEANEAAAELLEIKTSEGNPRRKGRGRLQTDTPANAKGFAAIFRVHDSPDMGKIYQWVKYARIFGVPAGKIPGKIEPQTVQRWFAATEGNSCSYLLKSMLVRSMQRAGYSCENIGHFGLASDCYTHFTSPIRRYPDLIVHRLLKRHLFGESIDIPASYVKSAAMRSSATERSSEDAEREISLYKKLIYLQNNAENVYDAYINRVTADGFYVFLEKLLMTGFVDIAALPKGRWFADPGSCVIYKRNGFAYKLGDHVRINWISSDWDRLEALFAPAHLKN